MTDTVDSLDDTSTPFEDGDDVGEVVAPDGAVGAAFEFVPAGICGERRNVFGAARHDDPLRGFFAA